MDDLKHMEGERKQVLIIGGGNVSTAFLSTLRASYPDVQIHLMEDEEPVEEFILKPREIFSVSSLVAPELTQKDIKRYDKISKPSKYGKHKKFDKHKF